MTGSSMDTSEVQAWRRHLHAHPETAFEEHATARFVAEKLRSFGLQVTEGLAGTGVVATLPGHGNGRTIALRADIDALDVEEGNDVPPRLAEPGQDACVWS